MNTDPDDVVRVAAGDMLTMEMYKQGLSEAGIEARVVGESLAASFGTAIPNSVEVWVHQTDSARARAVIRELEEERAGPGEGAEPVPHPESDPKPRQPGGHGPHTHYDANPGS
jgi:hypothetical protein